METVQNLFDDEMLEASDLAILYEVTGYQAVYSVNSTDFWENYTNSKDLAAEKMLLN